MTDPKRFAVPLEELEAVEVASGEQVEEVAAWQPPVPGGGPHPYGDGMADADGD